MRIDPKFIAIACDRESDVFLVIVDWMQAHTLIIHSQATKEDQSAMGLFQTPTELVLYHEQKTEGFALSYNLNHLSPRYFGPCDW
jgi:hypothetical protein